MVASSKSKGPCYTAGPMAQSAHHVFTFADYVRVEEDSPIKHEFFEGRVWAMAGGSPRHAAIAARIIATLTVQLRDRPCEVFTSDLRVRVTATGLGTYPDASVVCGALSIDAEDPKQHTVINPKVLVEVTSPSTEEYDRGDKRKQYQTIWSLEELVLVSHDAQSVSIWRREGERWSEHTVTGSAVAELTSIGCRLSLEDIYREPLLAD